MAVVKLAGMIIVGEDWYHVDPDRSQVAIEIGGKDLMEEVQAVKWAGPVTVAIGDERFTGDLVAEDGWGYSEYTPMDPDMLKVGPHDILSLLADREGEEVAVWIADEPVDLLGESGV